MTVKHKCWYCHGKGVIERNGKTVICSECGGTGGWIVGEKPKEVEKPKLVRLK